MDLMLPSWRDAPWWNPDSPQDNSPIIRHAPDDSNYHYPDGRQLERMRSGIGLPVVVPRARNDGRSMGFDPTVAGIVHVDPDAPDGGAVVDLTQLNKQLVNQAVTTSRFPHEVFYKLGSSPASMGYGGAPQSNTPTGFQRDTGHTSGYVVPQSNSLGQQMWAAPHQQPQASAYGSYQMAYPVQEAQMLPPVPPFPPGSPLVPMAPGQSVVVPGPAPYQAQQQPQQPQQPSQAQQPPQQPQYPVQYQNLGPNPYPQPTQPPYYPPPASPPPSPAFDPNVANMLGQTLAGLQAISGRLAALEQRPMQPLPPMPAAPPPNMAHAGGIPAVQTHVVGRDPTGYGVQSHPARQHYLPARAAPRKQRGEDNPYADADPNQKPVFEPIGAARAVEDETYDERPQHLSDLESRDDPRDGLIVGFEELKIQYVTGPKPMKPKRRVFFEFPGRGKQSALYHEVVISPKAVTLIYDTRYEEGTQFEPPSVNEEGDDPEKAVIKLHVPHLKKTYDVILAGISYPHGCFDHVVLPLVQTEDLDYEEKQ